MIGDFSDPLGDLQEAGLMAGLGTIVNAAAILFGGLCGLLFGRFLSEQAQDSLCRACGLCTLFIGISGTLSGMMTVDGTALVSGGTMKIVLCLSLGALIGELCGFEERIERFGTWLKEKSGNGKDSQFVHAFVTASLTVCIGAMAVIGSIQDGIMADPSILLTKSALDLIIILVMTSSMGKGCIFSAVPVALFQGSITALAQLIRPIIMTGSALADLSLIGSILIFCVGVNLVWGKTIRVANLLPAIVLAVAFSYL